MFVRLSNSVTEKNRDILKYRVDATWTKEL